MPPKEKGPAPCWKFMTKSGPKHAKCNLCGKLITVDNADRKGPGSSGGSTGNMIRHLKSQHLQDYKEELESRERVTLYLE